MEIYTVVVRIDRDGLSAEKWPLPPHLTPAVRGQGNVAVNAWNRAAAWDSECKALALVRNVPTADLPWLPEGPRRPLPDGVFA